MANEMDLWRSNRLSPFAGVDSLQRMMNRMFDDFWEPFGRDVARDVDMAPLWDFTPPIEVEETDDHYVYCLDVPGVNKNDIKIEVANNTLVVSGERREEERGRGTRSIQRRYGRFQRAIGLLGSVDANKVEASYENGVLKVAVPKTEEMKARQIPISEGKSGVFQKIASGAKETKDRLVGSKH